MKVNLPQLNKVLECEKGTSLFKLLRAHDIPVASSCLGDGVCGKCVLTISQGMLNLSPPEALEKKLMIKYNLDSAQRISCQTQVYGDIEVTCRYW